MIGAWRIIGRISSSISEKTHKRILIIFIALSAILQFVIGNRLRFTPLWDVEAIFGGAQMWALTGELDGPGAFGTTFGMHGGASYVFQGSYLRYLAMKSVQWGGAFLFRWLFWVYNLFGGTDFHIPALVWNVTMVQAMVFALYSAAKRLKGLQAGLYVLFLLCIFLPFHFFGAVYYTDTLSMPFVAIAFSLYLKGRDEATLRKKLLFFAACGLAAAVGSVLKATAMIVLIAIFIDFLLVKEKKGWAQRLLCAGALAFGFIIIYGGFYMYMSRRVIGPELTERYRIPRTHWAMLGLQGYGHYNTWDFNFTLGFRDLETRQIETSRLFRERLRGQGVIGMGNLYSAKFTINFGDGTYELHRILHLAPVNQTRLHHMVLGHGYNFNAYRHIATGFTTAMLLLMLVMAIRAFIKPSREHTAVPWLSFFGLALLLTFWESGGRLTMAYFPMLVIGAIIGLSVVQPWLTNLFENISKKELST